MKFIVDNLTKILGTFSTVITTMMTMIASGVFEGLLDPKDIRWLGIFGMLVGAAITGVGFNNTSKERIARAMETAIKAQPPEVIS